MSMDGMEGEGETTNDSSSLVVEYASSFQRESAVESIDLMKTKSSRDFAQHSMILPK